MQSFHFLYNHLPFLYFTIDSGPLHLPPTLRGLEEDASRDIALLPSTITHLSLLSTNSTSPWPPHLTHLKLTQISNFEMHSLPSSLLHFTYGGKGDSGWISKSPSPLPPNLQYLILGISFYTKLTYLPPCLSFFNFSMKIQ